MTIRRSLIADCDEITLDASQDGNWQQDGTRKDVSEF